MNSSRENTYRYTRNFVTSSLLLVLMLMGFQNCGPGFKSLDSYDSFDSSSLSNGSPLFNSFQKVMVKNCNNCHGNVSSPFPGIANFENLTTELAWANSAYIVAQNPTDSSLYNRLRFAGNEVSNNMPFSAANFVDTMTQAEADIVRDFINSVSVGNNNNGNKKLSSQSAHSALAKVKTVLQGATVTNSEMSSAIQNNQLNKPVMKTLVRQWVQTPEGQNKMQKFFALNLQQNFSYQSNTIFGNSISSNSNVTYFQKWQGNLKDSFGYTALDIVNNDRPFTEIATTRRHAVTTALLSSYSFADNSADIDLSEFSTGRRLLYRFLNKTHSVSNPAEDDKYNDIKGQILQDSDFEDWRFVTFNQSANNTGTTAYDAVSSLRAVNDGGSFNLALPRVGFFNTLAFQLKWPTNSDNSFRVTTNQALISALGMTFEAGDPTAHGNQAGLDSEHAGPGTSCFQCHRLMDPMRETFKLQYNFGYRYNPVVVKNISRSPAAQSPNFHFQGHAVSSINSMDQLGQAIVSHPDFAKSWVQRLCSYVNSSPCDENDPELDRVATVFKNSNYKFMTLIEEMMTSSLVVGDLRGPAGTETGISINRENHFCDGLTTKVKAYEAATGVNIPDSQQSYCALDNNARNVLPKDEVYRGETGVSQSAEYNFFSSIAFEKICAKTAERHVRTTYFPNSDAAADNTIKLILEHIMGVSESHPMYDNTLTTAHAIFARAKSIGLNAQSSMQQVFIFACTSPDSTGVGL